MIKLIFKHWIVIAILIVVTVLRFWRLEALTTFGGDQGYDFENVRQILKGNLTLLGPRIGPYNNLSTPYLGPFYYYLLAPFLWITSLDPIGAAYASLAARVLTIVLVYLISLRIFDRKSAIISATLSAISPYWINQLGFPSNVYFIPPTVALIILIMSHISDKSTVVWYLTIGLLTGFVFQFHYLGLLVLPGILIYFFYKYQRQKFIHIVWLLIGFITAISPLILFELRHKFFLTSQILKQINVGTLFQSSVSLWEKILRTGQLIAENIFGIPSVLLIVFSSIVFISIFKKSQAKKNELTFYLISLFIINFILVIFYPGSPQPHYMATAYPSIFLLIGSVIGSFDRLHRYIPILIVTAVIPFLFAKNNFFANEGYTMSHDLTLKEIRNISKIISEDVGYDSFNITSTLDGDSRAGPYRYLLKVYGKEPLSVQDYDKGDDLYVITRDPKQAAPKNSLFEIASFQPSEIATSWNIKGDIKLVKLTKKNVLSPQVEKFITIINPVRARKLWVDDSISHLQNQTKAIDDRGLAASWLLQYDTLDDEEVIDFFKSMKKNHEIGVLLEVSEKWATDARVSYKVGEGDYYRPDKVFLSGYSPKDREKLIKTYLKKFYSMFGRYPISVGAWYIDANSQVLLSKLGVKIALTVADQFDTDAASIWGKYFSMPYYPSRFNPLEPARNQSEKIDVVNIQWAQRDPVLGYGKEVKDSRHSFQANDYINNGFNFDYFEGLLVNYLNTSDTDLVQITIGLEAGQEAVGFKDEYEKQLAKIVSLQNRGEIKAVRMEQFADWYRNKFPGISPSHLLRKDDSFWYMSPKFRVAIFKERKDYVLADLRYYNDLPFRDYLYADSQHYLDRQISPVIDSLVLRNEINLGPSQKLELNEKFDRLILGFDNKKVEINTEGVFQDNRLLLKFSRPEYKSSLVRLLFLNKLMSILKDTLSIFKFSKIEDNIVFGLAFFDNKLIAFNGFIPGVYSYDFQVFSKFLSPSTYLEKWQPWIN